MASLCNKQKQEKTQNCKLAMSNTIQGLFLSSSIQGEYVNEYFDFFFLGKALATFYFQYC